MAGDYELFMYRSASAFGLIVLQFYSCEIEIDQSSTVNMYHGRECVTVKFG